MTQQTINNADRLSNAETDIEILWLLVGGLGEEQAKLRKKLRRDLREAVRSGASRTKIDALATRLSRNELKDYDRD